LPASLSAVRLAIACCFNFLQSVWPQPTYFFLEILL
jgi:hypothetical protein